MATRLKDYRSKRRFNRTPEPRGDARTGDADHRFVVQKHAAQSLHYDFRLQFGGVLKSWAVPKGPSLDPAEKSLAVRVEDHPLEYAEFEGIIPEEEYGGGTVMLWDHGFWEPEGDPEKGLNNGKLHFRLRGEKLRGRWNLVRMRGDGKENWLLIKSKDEEARPKSDFDVLEERPLSVSSERDMDAIAERAQRVWSAERGANPPESGSGVDTQRSDPGSIEGARRGSLPDSFEPELATLASRTPDGSAWLHELKFDGYRMIARIEAGGVRLITRKGNDWTDRFPSIVDAVAERGWDRAMLDGEVVVLTGDGTTDFQALQNVLRSGETKRVVYFVFDLPFFEGFDLRKAALEDRKKLLARLLGKDSNGVLRYSDHIVGRGSEMYEHACRHGLEGIVSKRARSGYRSGRTRDWIKAKCLLRQEFVVGGWTDPGGSRQGFGALLLGVHDEEGLSYCGRVGTGFNARSLEEIAEMLEDLETGEAPFHEPPVGNAARGVHWAEPRLVAEVAFTEWTGDGMLRHPSFQGLREDKSPDEVVREKPEVPPRNADAPASGSASTNGRARRPDSGEKPWMPGGVRLTHPDRVLYPDQGVTKRELAEFYTTIADLILPHVVGRPLTLVRCPSGRGGDCFYQKHLTDTMPEELHGVDVEEKGKTSTYVMIDDLPGLIALVQMSVLELHPWPARADRLDRPDRLVFDLDPGEGVAWQDVIGAARDVRDRLERFGLDSFVKTSGGKGLHVVVPLTRRSTWDELKEFGGGVARGLAQDHPDRYVATMRKDIRKGKVFVDFFRNQRGATSVATYSTRALPGAPVATPLRWDELRRTRGADAYTLGNLASRLSRLKGDPWGGFFDLQQTLTSAMLKEAA